MNATEYVRICPVCGTEHPPAASQCSGCGTLLIGVDLTLRKQAEPAPAIPPISPPAAEPAPFPPAPQAPTADLSVPCPHADCGALNPAGSSECVYCGRPLAAATAATKGLYNLPSVLAANFVIDRVLPAGGVEAELMLLKGIKTGVRVMAKLYRPGIAPKGEVLEQVGRVAHAHVVRLLAHGVSDGIAYEVMEYCAGGSLRDIMSPGLAPDRIRLVLAEVAEALAALHECRVVHRDLKPENVLVRRIEPLDLVLTDFGIASLQDATQFFTGLARTARYAAPEAMTGILDEAADYWSLGMMMVEMLQGEHPFAGLSDAVIAHRLATGGVDTAGVRDPDWRRLCRGLLQRDPARRWRIGEVRRWLAGDATLPDPGDSAHTLAEAYRVEGEECRSLTEIAIAFSRHWEAARKDLARGQFETWVREKLKDHDLLRKLHDLKERGGSPDLLLFRLIRDLAPGAPPAWQGRSLEVEAILATAVAAAGGDGPAGDWLASLFSEHVLELLPAAEFPDQTRLIGEWNQAWKDFGNAWKAADQALGKWRDGNVDSGEVVVDIDSLMYGIDGGLRRPAPERIHGPLLLVKHRPDYARQLRTATLAEASAHFEHSPWLEVQCEEARREDDTGLATLVAVMHLLPQARQASDDGHRRIEARTQRRSEENDRLTQRVNASLAEIRTGADRLGLYLSELGRQRLATSIGDFLALARDARALPVEGDGPLAVAQRAIARAEPLVLGMRDRLEAWNSTSRINALWQNEHLGRAIAIVFFSVLIFARQWMALLLLLPVAFWGWRTWIVADHRRAIRRLADGLPLRLSRPPP